MKNKITTVLTLCVALMLNISTTAQVAATSTEFSLQAAIDYGLKHNLNYLNAEADLQSAKYRKKEILGVALPQINGTFDFKDFIKIPTSVLPNFVAPATTAVLMQNGIIPYDPSLLDITKYPPIAAQFGTKYNATASITASQLIFSTDYIIGVKATKELLKLTTRGVLRTKVEIVQNISKAYYMVLVNNERIKLLDANIERLDKLFNDTKIMNEQGFVEKIDMDRLEVMLNNLKVERDKIMGMIGVSELLLKFQMGYKLSDPFTLTDKLTEESGQGVNLIEISKIDFSARAEYQLLESQKHLYDLELKRAKYAYFPSLIGYGSYGGSALRSKFDFFDNSIPQYWYETSVAGFTLNVPIFSGFQRHWKIQQSKLTVLKAKNSLELIQSAIQLETASSATSYQNAALSLDIQKKNVALARNIFDVSEKKFKAGVGSNLELIIAQTSLKEAETNYQAAIYDMIIAKIDYAKAIGTLVK